MTTSLVEKPTSPAATRMSPTRWIPIAAGVVVIAAVALIALSGDDLAGERTDLLNQGADNSVLEPGGATLVRTDAGMRLTASMPTPVPGSYEYPTSDMTPPWSDSHPVVVPGSDTEPEAFTMWVIVFNYPGLCTDNACDADDLDPDSAVKTGIFQGDARIGDTAVMEFAGSLRVGQAPQRGSVLENPHGAEVHIAIAPHGKALTGPDLWRQLNGPVGSPALWWNAEFRLG